MKGLNDMLYTQSALTGFSGTSRNMVDLLASAEQSAKEAIEYFCYHMRRHLVGLTASLGGLNRIFSPAALGPTRLRCVRLSAKGCPIWGSV